MRVYSQIDKLLLTGIWRLPETEELPRSFEGAGSLHLR